MRSFVGLFKKRGGGGWGADRARLAGNFRPGWSFRCPGGEDCALPVGTEKIGSVGIPGAKEKGGLVIAKTVLTGGTGCFTAGCPVPPHRGRGGKAA